MKSTSSFYSTLFNRFNSGLKVFEKTERKVDAAYTYT